jgi:hypothetical protein
LTVATIDYLRYGQDYELPTPIIGVVTRPQNTEDQPFQDFQREWVDLLPGKAGEAGDEEAQLDAEAFAPTVLRPGELTMERIRHARGKFVIAVTDEQAAEIAPFFEGDTA